MIGHVDRAIWSVSPGRAVARIVTALAFEGRPAGVKAQFLDPPVRRHLAWAAERAPAWPVDRPVFLLGVGRSGTTILGRLLSAHPEVGYLNEAKALAAALHPHEDVSGYYDTSGRGRFRLEATDATPSVRSRAHHVYGWYARVSRSERVVHKYPELTYRRPFLQAVFPGARFVAIVRPADEVAHSIARFSRTLQRGNQDWWGVDDAKWRRLWGELVEGHPGRRERLAAVEPDRLDDAQRGLVEWAVGGEELLDTTRGTLPYVVTLAELSRAPGPTVGRVLQASALPVAPEVVRYAETVVRPAGPVPPPVPAPSALRAWVDEVGTRLEDRVRACAAVPPGQA